MTEETGVQVVPSEFPKNLKLIDTYPIRKIRFLYPTLKKINPYQPPFEPQTIQRTQPRQQSIRLVESIAFTPQDYSVIKSAHLQNQQHSDQNSLEVQSEKPYMLKVQNSEVLQMIQPVSKISEKSDENSLYKELGQEQFERINTEHFIQDKNEEQIFKNHASEQFVLQKGNMKSHDSEISSEINDSPYKSALKEEGRNFSKKESYQEGIIKTEQKPSQKLSKYSQEQRENSSQIYSKNDPQIEESPRSSKINDKKHMQFSTRSKQKVDDMKGEINQLPLFQYKDLKWKTERMKIKKSDIPLHLWKR